jgi:hypothetical protein
MSKKKRDEMMEHIKKPPAAERRRLIKQIQGTMPPLDEEGRPVRAKRKRKIRISNDNRIFPPAVRMPAARCGSLGGCRSASSGYRRCSMDSRCG